MDFVEKISAGGQTLALIVRRAINTPGVSFFTPEDFSQQLAYMQRLGRQIAGAAAVSVSAECLQEQDIVDGICRASERGVDLVVAASRGHGWLERVWHGGTMHQLIDRIGPPTLILRGNGLSASLAPRRWLKRLLVPLDGSEHAERVFGGVEAEEAEGG